MSNAGHDQNARPTMIALDVQDLTSILVANAYPPEVPGLGHVLTTTTDITAITLAQQKIIDENGVGVLTALSSSDGVTPVRLVAIHDTSSSPAVNRLLIKTD